MGTTSKRSKKAAADWSLVPRGPVSATVQAGLGLVAAAGIGNVAHVSPSWGLGAAAVGALGTVLVSAHRNATPTALIYRMGCWVGAGGWLTWALMVSPWQRDTMVGLSVELVAAGICAPFANHTRPADGRHPGTAVVLAGGGRVGRDWAERITRVCRIRVTVTDVRQWDTDTGYDIHVDLPAGGATTDTLARSVDGLAADARLPDGCGVEIARGGHRGAAILRVSTVNRLFEDIDQPDDHSPRSILEPVELGEYRDGSITGAPLRELSGLVIGQKGSGKTNLLDLFNHGIGRCVDALVWHIDLNGGGMSQAWLHPWLEDDTERPAIDWAACTPREALEMVEAALAIAKDRKRSYRKLKIKENTRLLPISATLPEIVIIVDEGKTVLAPGARGIIGDIRAGLIEIQDIARDAAVNIIASGLRATADTIDTSLKVQAGLRIGMFVEKDAELAYLFDWNKGISTADLPTQGCAFIQYGFGGGTPRTFKTRLMRPRQIVEAAIQIAERRPDLDEAGIAAAGTAYETRYERMRAAFTGDLDEDDDQDVVGYGGLPASLPATFDDDVKQGVPVRQGASAVTDPSAWPTLGRPHLTVINAGAADWADPADMAVGESRRPVLVGAAEWPDIASASSATRLPAPSRTPQPGAVPATRPVPRILTDLVAIFAAHDADRLHTADILTVLRQNDPTMTAKGLSTLLGKCGGLGPRPQPWGTGDDRGRGYYLSDVDQAAERIRTGRLISPRETYAWPPRPTSDT